MNPLVQLAEALHPTCWFWETDRVNRLVWISQSNPSDGDSPPLWRHGETEAGPLFPTGDGPGESRNPGILETRAAFNGFLVKIPHGDTAKTLSFSGAPYFDRRGDFAGFRGIVHHAGEDGTIPDGVATGGQPVTAGARETPDKRAEIQNRLQSFVATASDWFWECDEQLRFTYMSGAFELITGASSETWIGKRIWSLIEASGTSHDSWAANRRNINKELPFRNLCFALRLEGKTEAWISASGRPVFDPRGRFTGYQGICRDITEQVTLEKALRGALEDAKQANAAKIDFLSSMSHELRTPLNGVLGFGQLLKMDDEKSLTENQRESVDQILVCGKHLLSLIEDVLDLSRIDQNQLYIDITDAPPQTIVNESRSMVSSALTRSGLQFEMTGIDLDTAPLVRADTGRAKQVLVNLLSNAIKYNTTGARITLSCTIVNGTYLRFAVADDGPGIVEEQQTHLFQPFNRLGMEKNKIEGTGIGLTVSKKLVELMAGKIGFETAPGRGSRFWFDLPLADVRQPSVSVRSIPQIRDVPSEAEAEPLRQVLYIEDNPANMMLMMMVAKRLRNVALIPAETAELGLQIALEEPPDLILMDINLPGMSGIEALRDLRSVPELKKIPVIAVTAAAMPSDLDAAESAGFDHYLTKPIEIGTAMEIIERTLESKFTP